MSTEGVDFLKIDDFADAVLALLTPTPPWIINDVSRYFLTHVDGLTPTGKAFTLDVDATGTVLTLVVGGHTQTVTVASAASLLQGSLLVQKWQQAYNALPKAQQ